MTLFDATTEKAKLNNRSPLAAGTYPMFIADIKFTEDRYKNEYILLEFEVGSGDSKGRKHWENCYLSHSKEATEPERYGGMVQRGRAIIKALCDAGNIDKLEGPSDFRQFVGFPIKVKLGLYAPKDKEARNIINDISVWNPEPEDDVPDTPQAKSTNPFA